MIKIKPYKQLVFACIFCLILVVSCKKEESVWWDADLSGPIAQTELNLANLLPDSVLISDPDSALRIYFSSNIFNYKVDSLVSIPDTTIDTSYTSILANTIAFAPGSPIFSSTNETYFDIQGANLNYLKLKTGIIKIETFNSVPESLNFKYELGKSLLNGQVFSVNFDVPGGSISSPGSSVQYYTIDGIELDLTGTSGNKYNTAILTSTVAVSNGTDSAHVSGGHGLNVKITFSSLVPYYATGYMGNQQMAVGPDTLNFDFFKGLNADYFALQDANVNLKMVNGFGVDMSASNVFISSLNTNSGNNITLAGSGVSTAYNLNRATYTGVNPSPVIPYIKNIPLNALNSNIKPFLENLPDKITYGVNAQVNPLGNVSMNHDFLQYGYGFSADLEMDVPLAFATTNLRLQDTADFNISTIDPHGNINSGVLTLRADNGYPFDAAIQVVFTDENYVVLDSLFASPNTALAGNVDASLKVTSRRLSLLNGPLDKAKMEKIRNARKIIFKVVMNTVSQTQIVKIYNYYSMGLTLTADVNYSVNKK